MPDEKPKKPPFSTRKDGLPVSSSKIPTAMNDFPDAHKSIKRRTMDDPDKDGTNPAEQILMKASRVLSYDPNDPESVLHDSRRKFTVPRKLQFLKHLATYGRLNYAAHRVGITAGTVSDHRKADPEFDELVKQAVMIYEESCVVLITQQALFGIVETRRDKEGNILNVRRVFETRLRELILKRADPSYNETQKQEVTMQGGAIMVPTPLESVAHWDDVVAALSGKPSATISTTGTPAPAALPAAPAQPVEEIEKLPIGSYEMINNHLVDVNSEAMSRGDAEPYDFPSDQEEDE